MTTDYGVPGCRCFADDVGPDTSKGWIAWIPNTYCPYHGLLGRDRMDTGQYRVVDLSTPPDGPECPPGLHSMFDPCPGGCLNEGDATLDDGTPNPCPEGECTGDWSCPRECPDEPELAGPFSAGRPPRGCSCSVNESEPCSYCSAVAASLGTALRGGQNGKGFALTAEEIAGLFITEQKERGEDPAGGIFATIRRWIHRTLWGCERSHRS